MRPSFVSNLFLACRARFVTWLVGSDIALEKRAWRLPMFRVRSIDVQEKNMKRWIASVLMMLLVPSALAQNEKNQAVKRVKVYGPPVKLDISGNYCEKKGDEAYVHSLFYEEFKSLSECQAALNRRS